MNARIIELEPWISKAQACKLWSCSERSLEGMMGSGMPHAIIVGRVKFRPSQCEQWMRDNGFMELRESA